MTAFNIQQGKGAISFFTYIYINPIVVLVQEKMSVGYHIYKNVTFQKKNNKRMEPVLCSRVSDLGAVVCPVQWAIIYGMGR